MSSKSKSTQTTDTHQVQGPEQWMQDEGESLYHNAANAIPTAFKKYGGERVADYGSDFYDARDMVRGMDAETPDLDRLRTVLDTLYNKDADYLKGSTQDHMNPFTDAVLSPQLRKLDEARKGQLNEDNARATMAGAFGDPQAGLVRAETNDRYNTQLSDATSAAYKDAWDRAQAQDNTVASRFANTGQGYAGLDQAIFNKKSALAKFLTQFGMADQQLNQARDDVKYDDWKMSKQGGWAMTRSTLLNQLLNAVPHDTIMDGHSKTETEQPDNSGLQMLGKLAGTALGAAVGGPAGASIGGSLGGGLFGSGGGGGGQAGASSSMGFFAPNGSTVNGPATGGQFEWSPGGYFSV
jgi:hypothetical protein